MFGNNLLRKADKGDGFHLDVQDIFYTIQGEGPFAGAPCVFVRLWGCNLRCHFCDTDFESKQRRMPIWDIVSEIVAATPRKPKLVVLTGGEPMRQNIYPLCDILSDSGVTVQIETAGTLWVENLDKVKRLHIVCSPKTGSVHPKIEANCENWKYLVRQGEIDEVDGLPNMSTQVPGVQLRLYRPSLGSRDTIWLQPCEEYQSSLKMVTLENIGKAKDLMTDQRMTAEIRDEEGSRKNVALCASLAMKHGYRVSYQLHKVLGLP